MTSCNVHGNGLWTDVYIFHYGTVRQVFSKSISLHSSRLKTIRRYISEQRNLREP